MHYPSSCAPFARTQFRPIPGFCRSRTTSGNALRFEGIDHPHWSIETPRAGGAGEDETRSPLVAGAVVITQSGEPKSVQLKQDDRRRGSPVPVGDRGGVRVETFFFHSPADLFERE